jgi:hypothetical protein
MLERQLEGWPQRFPELWESARRRRSAGGASARYTGTSGAVLIPSRTRAPLADVTVTVPSPAMIMVSPTRRVMMSMGVPSQLEML